MSIAQISFQAIAFKVDTLGSPIKSQFKPEDLISEINLEIQTKQSMLMKEAIIESISDDFCILRADSENDRLIGAFKKRILNPEDLFASYGSHSVLFNKGKYSLITPSAEDCSRTFLKQRPTGFVLL